MVAPYLEFDDAYFSAPDRRMRPLDGVELAVAPGELLWVTPPDAASRLPLADAACGVLACRAGAVRIAGEPWGEIHPNRAAFRRSRIGRVYHHGGWISNLNVRENILLARRHHGDDSENALAEEAESWARRFLLDAVPRSRPAETPGDALRAAEWVRAMLCRPRLLLLENPLVRAAGDAVAAFGAAIAEQRRRKCAVLWISLVAPPESAGRVDRKAIVRGRRAALEEPAS